MIKFFFTSLISILILFTAFIKNSTKRIDDEIFVINENLRILEKEFGDLKLENNYLSSGKKLMELQSEFFDKQLESKKTNKISFLIKDKKKLIIKNLEISEGD